MKRRNRSPQQGGDLLLTVKGHQLTVEKTLESIGVRYFSLEFGIEGAELEQGLR